MALFSRNSTKFDTKTFGNKTSYKGRRRTTLSFDIYSTLHKNFYDEFLNIGDYKTFTQVWNSYTTGALRVWLRAYKRRTARHADRTGHTRRSAKVVRGNQKYPSRVEWYGSAQIGILDRWGGKTTSFVPYEFIDEISRKRRLGMQNAALRAGNKAMEAKVRHAKKQIDKIRLQLVKAGAQNVP